MLALCQCWWMHRPSLLEIQWGKVWRPSSKRQCLLLPSVMRVSHTLIIHTSPPDFQLFYIRRPRRWSLSFWCCTVGMRREGWATLLSPSCACRSFQKQLDAPKSWWCWGHLVCFPLWLLGQALTFLESCWQSIPMFINCSWSKPVWRCRTKLKSSQSWEASCTDLWPSPSMATYILERIGMHLQSRCDILHPEKPQGSRAHLHVIFRKSWTFTFPLPSLEWSWWLNTVQPLSSPGFVIS